MIRAIGLPLLLAAIGQGPTEGDPMPESPADRLAFMRESLAGYKVRPAGPGAGDARLRDEPVLRFTNPVGGSKDGAVFLWIDEAEGGRPSASAQVYWNPGQYFLQEFSSLATTPLVARSDTAGDWAPARPGVAFRPIPDAPKPAATPEGRSRQMKALSEGFSARHFYKAKTWNQLRLLPKPLLRYGKAGSLVEDGALFCFGHGTDPEVLLLVEARPGPDGAAVAWRYALAPMTSAAATAAWKDGEIWTIPAQANGSARDRSNTFVIRRYSGPPK